MSRLEKVRTDSPEFPIFRGFPIEYPGHSIVSWLMNISMSVKDLFIYDEVGAISQFIYGIHQNSSVFSVSSDYKPIFEYNTLKAVAKLIELLFLNRLICCTWYL